MNRLRPLLIAAVIGLIAALGGCVVYTAYPLFPAKRAPNHYSIGWHEGHGNGLHSGGWHQEREDVWRH